MPSGSGDGIARPEATVTTPGAPVYINIGDAGNREGPCPDYYPQPEWSAFRESRFGHGDFLKCFPIDLEMFS